MELGPVAFGPSDPTNVIRYEFVLRGYEPVAVLNADASTGDIVFESRSFSIFVPVAVALNGFCAWCEIRQEGLLLGGRVAPGRPGSLAGSPARGGPDRGLLGHSPCARISLLVHRRSSLGIGFQYKHRTEIAEDGSSEKGRTTKTRLVVALATVFYEHRAIQDHAYGSQFRLLWGLLFGYVERGGAPSWWTPLLGYDSGARGGHLTLFWGLLDLD